MKKFIYILSALGLSLALSACSGNQYFTGLNDHSVSQGLDFKFTFEPLCSAYYANISRVGTSVTDAPGILPMIYRLRSVNTASALYSVVDSQVVLPSFDPLTIKNDLLSTNSTDINLGNLSDGNYFLSMCSSDPLFRSHCTYQAGEAIVHRMMGTAGPKGSGILLVASATSAPIIFKVTGGVVSLTSFSTPSRIYHTTPLLLSGTCSN